MDYSPLIRLLHQLAAQRQLLGAQPNIVNYRIGFDCEFVESPPQDKQTECPVCLQIIHEPYQVTCCGNRFCRSCIQRIIAEGMACPTCNNKHFSVSPDKDFRDSLYSLQVRCSHQKDGCEWTGELGQLDEHLNKDPLPEKRFDGCEFVEMKCPYCKEEEQRQYIQVHQNEHCTKRPFSCEYCKQYKSNFDDVIHNHWPVCGFHPVRCPNECGLILQNQNLDNHVADGCLLTIISCDFHHVGCGVKLPRKDMPEHLRENLHSHMSLLAVSHANLTSSNGKQQAQILKLTGENNTLKRLNKAEKERIESRMRELKVYHRSDMDRLNHEITKLTDENNTLKNQNVVDQRYFESSRWSHHQEVKNLKADCDALKANIVSKTRELSVSRQETNFYYSTARISTLILLLIIPLGVFIAYYNIGIVVSPEETYSTALQVELPVPSDRLIMAHFKEHKKAGDSWYSLPVYTHHHGYRIRLRVDANGHMSGARTHVSVYVVFMKGEFDYSLQWPFRGVISFQLLDQVKGEDHKTYSITYDSTVNDKFCRRVTKGEMAKVGRGSAKFIAHRELRPNYLQADALHFQIHKAELH